MIFASRPLAGRKISISISESNDSSSRGFPSWQINRVTLQLVAAFFGQGASLVFGHDWREDGLMEAIYGFARQVQPPIPLSEENTAAESQPLLWNVLPWPDAPYLSGPDRERLSSTLRVESAGLPMLLQALADEAFQAASNDKRRNYVRARGLTHLRHRLTEISDVRLCLGGRGSGFAGRYPGVVEEAYLALRAQQPLYLVGLLGGVTEQVIDALQGKQMPESFCSALPHGLYRQFSERELAGGADDDRVIDRELVWAEFANTGIERLAAANGLSVEENLSLMRTPVIDQVIELVLTGVSRIAKG